MINVDQPAGGDRKQPEFGLIRDDSVGNTFLYTLTKLVIIYYKGNGLSIELFAEYYIFSGI